MTDATNSTIEFEWDSIKAKRNFSKHGVSFDEATSAFDDPLSVTISDPDHESDECRYLLIGKTAENRLVVVAHTDKCTAGDPLRTSKL